MRTFPQLSSGAGGQYPLRRVRRERVVSHEALDGRVMNYLDVPGASVAWQLACNGLTEAERTAIDDLFRDCEGRLQTFLFLDPAANLLRWSEDYSQSAWTRGPMLQGTAGIADPWGSTRAFLIANSGGAGQALTQTVAGPGAMHYCFSIYARGTGAFQLRIDSGGAVVQKEFTANATWMRYVLGGRPGSTAETVTFSVILPAGGQLELTGAQADVQPAAGGYRRTTTRSGVFPNARFDHDSLAWLRQAANEHAATIRIVSRAT